MSAPKYIVRPTGSREEHEVCRVHDKPKWHEVIGYGETFTHAMFMACCLSELSEAQLARATRRTDEANGERTAA